MRRLCPACGREVRPELVELRGGDEVVSLAGQDFNPEPGEYVRAALRPTIRLSCSCSYIDVETVAEVTPRQIPSAWDPDGEEAPR